MQKVRKWALFWRLKFYLNFEKNSWISISIFSPAHKIAFKNLDSLYTDKSEQWTTRTWKKLKIVKISVVLNRWPTFPMRNIGHQYVKRSQTSHNWHKHNMSPTSVTNIDIATEKFRVCRFLRNTTIAKWTLYFRLNEYFWMHSFPFDLTVWPSVTFVCMFNLATMHDEYIYTRLSCTIER